VKRREEEPDSQRSPVGLGAQRVLAGREAAGGFRRARSGLVIDEEPHSAPGREEQILASLVLGLTALGITDPAAVVTTLVDRLVPADDTATDG